MLSNSVGNSIKEYTVCQKYLEQVFIILITNADHFLMKRGAYDAI